MTAQTDQALDLLRAHWPQREIWVVHRVVGGALWCARRLDDQRRLLHADTPDQLIERLEKACSR